MDYIISNIIPIGAATFAGVLILLQASGVGSAAQYSLLLRWRCSGWRLS